MRVRPPTQLEQHHSTSQLDACCCLYRRRTPGNAPVEVGTTADFLAALEARANGRTAGDPPSHAHRCVLGSASLLPSSSNAERA